MKVVVFGSASTTEEDILKQAYEVGSLIAQQGHTLLHGGGVKGVMGATMDGAHDSSGKVVSVITQHLLDKERQGEPERDNESLIITTSMPKRKEILIKEADLFLVLDGGFGTLDELFEIITLRVINEIQTPILILSPSLSHIMEIVVERTLKIKTIKEEDVKVFTHINSITELKEFL